MIDLKLNTKFMFFDRKIILSKDAGIRRDFWRQFNDSPIKKAGVIVMKNARQSIRRGKPGGKPSKPGSPPRSRQQGSVPPFKQIFSVPDRFQASATIGMIGYGSDAVPTPAVHEHGLAAQRFVFEKKRTVKVRGRKARDQFIGRRVRRMVKYPPRPFMQPALEKAKAKLPELWRGSIR